MSEMLHYSKRVLVIIIAITLAFAFSACNEGGVADNGKPEKKTSFFVENNLEIENLEEEFSNGSGQYIQISGLKDKEVEKTINEMLYSEYMKLRDKNELPPYRGIKQMISDEDELSRKYISTNVAANINNILSVEIYKSCGYSNQYEMKYCAEMECLNIDLNSGKELLLKDLFDEGVDYEEFINGYIEKVALSEADMENDTYDTLGALCLTAPFKGITPEQKFLINQYNNSVSLVFDYNNPEVYCRYNQPLAYGVDNIKITSFADKFYDEEEWIYEDETKSFRMIVNPFDLDEFVRLQEIHQALDSEVLTVGIFAQYYNDMPKGALEYTKAMYASKDEFISEYENQALEYSEVYGLETLSGFASRNISVTRVGQFTTVSSDEYMWLYSGEENLIESDSRQLSCFKGESSKPMEIEDIFIEGYDVEQGLQEALMRSYEKQLEEGYIEELHDKEKMSEYFAEAVKRINGFMLNETHIFISYDNLEELIEKYFEDESGENLLWRYEEPCIYVSYESIGCDKLAIFE